MEQRLTMNLKELKRVKILEQIEQKKLTVEEGSESLSISNRQLYRLLKRYRESGDEGIIHRLRGRQSNRGYPKELKNKVLQLYRKNYKDFGPTLFAEKLEERHQIKLDHETVRRWLRSTGEITAIRKHRRHRKKRERKESIGEMLQFDGSHHDWFEGRTSVCCLLHAIDDASGKVYLKECTRNIKRICRNKWNTAFNIHRQIWCILFREEEKRFSKSYGEIIGEMYLRKFSPS